MKIKKTLGEHISQLLIRVSMILVICITLYPFVYVLSMSISEPIRAVSGEVWLYPKGFSLDAYKMVFQNKQVWLSYYNTLWYTSVGTSLNVVMTILAAYCLSRRTFFAKKHFMFFIAFTMFFSGGLIPMFVLINNLGLYNSRWVMILPKAVGAYYIIIARTFFTTIPESLSESAKLDGANDLTILYKIFIPLSKPIISVLVLYYAVMHWNSYFDALIYLAKSSLQPLQLFLVRVLVENDSTMMGGMVDQYERGLAALQLRFAIIIVAILPIICVYPFLQKYFVKGIMIGAIKG